MSFMGFILGFILGLGIRILGRGFFSRRGFSLEFFRFCYVVSKVVWRLDEVLRYGYGFGF